MYCSYYRYYSVYIITAREEKICKFVFCSRDRNWLAGLVDFPARVTEIGWLAPTSQCPDPDFYRSVSYCTAVTTFCLRRLEPRLKIGPGGGGSSISSSQLRLEFTCS